MTQVHHILKKLPPYKGVKRLIKVRQNTFDIIRAVLRQHEDSFDKYDRICMDHWTGDVPGTAKHLFEFLKQNVPYREEPTLQQTTKFPQAVLAERYTYGADCKHFAGYIVGVGEALRRRGFPVKAFYRFASYNPKRRDPGHVFAVFVHDGREIWIDPVPAVGGYDSRAIQPRFKVDKLPPMSKYSSIGSLYQISGIMDNVAGGPRDHWLDRSGMSVHHRHGLRDHRCPLKTDMRQHRDAAPAAPVAVTGHWMEEVYGQVGKGKKKKGGFLKKLKVPKIKIKAPHIKIQPGKLLKKVAMAPSRNAYMGLVKLNVFNLAVQLHNKVKKNAANWQKLHDFWEKKLGGNMNKLSTAIDMGVKMHNKLHPNKKVSGSDIYEQAEVYAINGFAGIGNPVAIPAMLAAAAPIIKALSNIMKAFGVKHEQAEGAAENADQATADQHNEATATEGDGNADVKADGSVDHGEGVTTKVTTDPDTGKQVVHYDVKDPTTHGTGTDNPDSSGSSDDDSDDDGDKEITKTKTKTVTKHHGAAGGAGFADMMANVKDFVVDHKYWFIGGGIFVMAIIILPKVFRKKSTTRRRK